jgi:hypothetical protein
VVLRELITKLGFEFDEKGYQRAEARFDALRGKADQLAGVGQKLSLYLTAPILALGTAAAYAANETEDAIVGMRNAFGSSADEAEKAAARIAEAYGLSTASAAKFLASTGRILSNFDLTDEKALQYSESIQQIAADWAAYTQIEGGTEAVTQTLTSALTGRTMALKQIGIIIDENEIKEKIAAMRAKGALFTSEKQAKALATLSLIQDRTAKSAGSYAKEADGLDESLSRIRERFVELGNVFGKILLPYLKPILKYLEGVVNRLIAMDDKTKKVVLVVAGLVAAVGPLLVVFSSLLGIAANLGTFFTALQAGALAASVPLVLMAGKILLIVGAVALLALALEDLYQFFTGGESVFGDFMDMLQAWGDSLTNWASGIAASINGFFDPIIDKIGKVTDFISGGAVRLNDFLAGNASPSQTSSGGASNTSNVSQNANLKVEVNASGMSPQDAATAVSSGVQSGLSNVFRQTRQNLVPAGEY